MIDTNELRGVCDLRSNNLDYWRDTARKFLPLVADEIDHQAALIAKYEKALRQYADQNNWAKTHGCEICSHECDPRDWWQQDGDGWELAEKALKEDSNQ